MADTVKKSRIVSETDDNLEETMMEEFNMRLKNCMSQDDLHSPDEDGVDPPYDQPKSNNNFPRPGAASIAFINSERACHDVAPSTTTNGTSEPIYENVASPLTHQTEKTDEKEIATRSGQYVDMTLNPPTPETSYELVEPPQNDYETIEEMRTAVQPEIDVTTNSTESDNDLKSVKDRMLLSTDVQPCLLFTQTVTSPMLTPSEENIDFLKGFRSEEENNGGDVTDLDNPIYENLKELDRDVTTENIYENLETFDEEVSETTNDDGDIITEPTIDAAEPTIDAVEPTIDSVEPTIDAAVVERSVVDEEISSTISNGGEVGDENLVAMGGDFEAPSKIVESLKEQLLLKGSENVAAPKTEMGDVGDLKSVDIMKQIHMFEKKDEEKDSTQVTEYVETTTIESKSSSDKGLKKKKSKKSRKEEKENISVNGTNINNHQESLYNVNVKSLCRSFGDLTKIEDDKPLSPNRICNNNYADTRARAKSLSDVTLAPPSNKFIENVFSGVSVRALREKFHNIGDNKVTKNIDTKTKAKSSFSKFDALQNKNVLHVRSSDPAKAQEKFNGAQVDSSNCKACDKAVFQMEQMKAEKAIWHRNCFRCKECNKQLNVDTYQSHEGTLYCKPHFKALFAPKAVEDEAPPKPKKPELIIRENQPAELPPDVVRASDKPDLGLEELQSLNVKQRFQVFEHHQSESYEIEKIGSAVNVKRSPSILSKLARFQAKGMDIGVADDALNGIPIEESSSEEERDEDDDIDGEDADLIRAKRVQKEKPFHFTGMSDVKSRWEQGGQTTTRDERREECKQEIQSIRNRIFIGKQAKMKEAYQQAVMESESRTDLRREPIEVCDTKSLKEKFEKGEMMNEKMGKESEDEEVFGSEISKNSRSLFLELDANASKAPQISPVITPKLDVKKAREAYLTRTSTEDVVKSSTDQVDDVHVRTADIQQRFKFFETYKEPEKTKKTFRITPPREGQVKAPTPDREVYRDPEVVRAEELLIEDSVVAKESHTATKMLSKFRQMEENLSREPQPAGPKPLKRFTPPPEPARTESSSEEGESGSEEESDEEEEEGGKIDGDLLEAQKAARAKQLRAKFEKWEANEIKKEQNGVTVNIVEESGEEQSQVESTRTLRARFESMRETTTESKTPRVKVNRFVDIPNVIETCENCDSRVYPLEKISVHGRIYHKSCFKCMECSCILRMESYSYNQGLLYCMPHFKRLFISKGNYETGFGLGQHKEKWNATLA